MVRFSKFLQGNKIVPLDETYLCANFHEKMIRRKTWPSLLKIEHRGKYADFANFSQTIVIL